MSAAAATAAELGAGSSIRRAGPPGSGVGAGGEGEGWGWKGANPSVPGLGRAAAAGGEPARRGSAMLPLCKVGRRAARRAQGPRTPATARSRGRCWVTGGAPRSSPALEGGESSRLARLQGRFCVVSALRYETSRSSRGAAPAAPGPSGWRAGVPGPRHAVSRVPRESCGTEMPEEPPSFLREAGNPHIRGKREISRSARTAAPLTWSWENEQQAPLEGWLRQGGGGAAPTGGLFSLEGQWWGARGPERGICLPFWRLHPRESWRVSPPFGTPHPQPPVDGVCCELLWQQWSCHEGLSKLLPCLPVLSFRGEQWGWGGGECADKGIQPPLQRKKWEEGTAM